MSITPLAEVLSWCFDSQCSSLGARYSSLGSEDKCILFFLIKERYPANYYSIGIEIDCRVLNDENRVKNTKGT